MRSSATRCGRTTLEHDDRMQMVVPPEIGVVAATAAEPLEGRAARGDLIALGEPPARSGKLGVRCESVRHRLARVNVPVLVSRVFVLDGPVPRVVLDSRDLDFEPSPLPEFFEPPLPEPFEPPEPRLLLAESPRRHRRPSPRSREGRRRAYR